MLCQTNRFSEVLEKDGALIQDAIGNDYFQNKLSCVFNDKINDGSAPEGLVYHSVQVCMVSLE